MRLIALAMSLLIAACSLAFDTRPTPVFVDGTRAIGDLPVGRHVRNIGGTDGAGLCVPTSVQMAADWHNVPQLLAFQKWASRRPGGSFPDQLDRDITLFCAEQKVSVPAYIQHVGGDESFLDLALKTGRVLGVTYAGVDGFYTGPIAHMVNLVHLDKNIACIVDNNRPGKFIWMTRQQFINRWRGVYDNGTLMTIREGGQTFQIGGGWAFCFLAAPPPPYAKSPLSMAPEALDVPEVKNFGILLKPLQPKAEEAPKEHNFGVNFEKLKTQRKFTLNGTEVTKSVAEAAVLADDSTRFHLSFVGQSVPTLPESIRSACHVQAYKADEWEVAQFGLKPGVTIRKPQAARVGAEIYQSAVFNADEVTAVLTGTPTKPKPDPKPVDPKPTPGPKPVTVTFTEQDLIPEAKQRLYAAGLGSFTFTLSGLTAPKAMPSTKEVAPEPRSTGPAKVQLNSFGVPVEAAPPGKRWSKPGLLHEPGEWVLEDAPVAAAPVRLPILTPVINGVRQCVNGVCR